MSRGHWFIVGAVAGLGLADAVEQAAYSQPRAVKSEQGAPRNAPPSPLTPVQESIDRLTRAVEASRAQPQPQASKADTERDLSAQEGMHLWAMVAAIVAAVIAVFTFVGLLLIWRTLVQTARAADSAKEMADEARKATAATTDLLMTERKPFLTLKPIEAERIRWNPETGEVGFDRNGVFSEEPVFCSIKSSGRSPAILTAICRSWAVVEGLNSPPIIDPEQPHPEGALFKLTDIPIGSDGIVIAADSEKIFKGAKGDAICFYGYMKFTDLDRKQVYVSGFYFRCQPRPISRGLVTGLPRDESDPGRYWYHQPFPNPANDRKQLEFLSLSPRKRH